MTALEDTGTVLDTRPNVGLVYTDYMVIDEVGRNQIDVQIISKFSLRKKEHG